VLFELKKQYNFLKCFTWQFLSDPCKSGSTFSDGVQVIWLLGLEVLFLEVLNFANYLMRLANWELVYLVYCGKRSECGTVRFVS
jgi:hypothetical protein